MSNFVCNRDCQIRLNDHITYIERGTVVEADENPKPSCFSAVDDEEYVLDFTTATKDELMAAKWKFSEASETMEEAYGQKLKHEEGIKKSEVVDQILDIRYRALDETPFKNPVPYENE